MSGRGWGIKAGFKNISRISDNAKKKQQTTGGETAQLRGYNSAFFCQPFWTCDLWLPLVWTTELASYHM